MEDDATLENVGVVDKLDKLRRMSRSVLLWLPVLSFIRCVIVDGCYLELEDVACG